MHGHTTLKIYNSHFVCCHQLWVPHVLLGMTRAMTRNSRRYYNPTNYIIIIVIWSPLYRGAGYITQQCTCLHTSSPYIYFKAQSKWGSAESTAHLSDVTVHRLQTMWQIWWLCFSLFANSSPPALVQTFIYALCSKFSVTLCGINIVSVTMSCMMASC
jgi:hypothetical protein